MLLVFLGGAMAGAALPAEGKNNVDDDKKDLNKNKKDMGESV